MQTCKPTLNLATNSYVTLTMKEHGTQLYLKTNILKFETTQYASAPCKLTFDLESGVTWATSVPILVFLALSVLDLGLMYATDRRRQTSDAHNRLMSALTG